MRTQCLVQCPGQYLGFFAAMMVAGLSLSAQAPARSTRATIKPVQTQTPFTAEFKISTVRTLGNGTTITRDSTEFYAVDSQGRSIDSISQSDASGNETTSTTVRDPVAGTEIGWITGTREAYVTPTRPSGAALDCLPMKPKAVPPEVKRRSFTQEDLGVQTIQGVEARGAKTTITTPTGAIGNSEPLVSTHEVWRAVAIKPIGLAVRQLDDDPQAGRSTREMTSVSLGEPDASIFEPPQGYEIVNREAPVAPCAAGGKTALVTQN